MAAKVHVHKVGDAVVLPADEVLGVAEELVVVVSIEPYGYKVKMKDGWVGPVNFELKALHWNCNKPTQGEPK